MPEKLTEKQKKILFFMIFFINFLYGLICGILIIMAGFFIEVKKPVLNTVICFMPYPLGIITNVFIYGIFRKRLDIDRKYIKIIIIDIILMSLIPLIALSEILGVINVV
ncbi:MAG: hypothetical protein LBM93_15275 [Oscillospiraceae bacterium]|jgi:hypothetical protein|nr:hypothetical protein [Oscillospiraceae bacterium]